MSEPSGLKTAECTHCLWPRTAICRPLAACQIRAVLSAEAVTISDPSGLKLPDSTKSSCPRSTATCLPVLVSHSRAVLSSDAVMMRSPFGSKFADLSISSCPLG